MSSERFIINDLTSRLTLFIDAFDTDENDTISIITYNSSIIIDTMLQSSIGGRNIFLNLTFHPQSIGNISFR